jgi:hypothetical protein
MGRQFSAFQNDFLPMAERIPFIRHALSLRISTVGALTYRIVARVVLEQMLMLTPTMATTTGKSQ